ncbi:MAG: TonB-dependent receptor [Burkholderiaceae bacterium]|nr:TonB-dependent receptor [Burkholderiaceae bacterium]
MTARPATRSKVVGAPATRVAAARVAASFAAALLAAALAIFPAGTLGAAENPTLESPGAGNPAPAIAAAGSAASAGSPSTLLSERDFLLEIPRVFSASRLPQSSADSPGEVTVIDREMIRALGARDVADLFRLVPGFVVGSAGGGRAVVAYHGLSGQISQRMQVLLDGRSLYAPYLFGGIDWNALPIGIDDIERIEVLRGSNSAAYGANAFLGVANIITRTAAQSHGGQVSLAAGNAGVRDVSARYGGGTASLAWRLSAGERGDDGLAGAFDSRRNRYLGARAEWQISATDELSLAAGVNENRLGLGRRNSAGDPERFEATNTSFGQLRWRRSFADDHEMSLAASYTADRGDDRYLIPLTPSEGLVIDYGRRAERAHLEYQHWLGLSDSLRASWGAEYRRDAVVARQLFNTSASQRSDATRAFVNLEWTPSPRWTFNAGGLVEHDSLSGTHLAPRLVANWKLSPSQTLRLGVSEAFRTPSLFEQRSDWRFVFRGETIDIRYLSRGGLRPERVRAAELSWQGEFRNLGLSIDARAFDERITDLITQQLYALPPGSAFDPNSDAYDLRNAGSARVRGLEYQLKWRPSSWQSWTLGHYFARRSGSEAFVTASVPTYGAHLLGVFKLPERRSISVFVEASSPIRWIGEAAAVGSSHRMDLRLEQGFDYAGLRGSLAMVVQALNGSVTDFRSGQSFERRGFLVLSLEY